MLRRRLAFKTDDISTSFRHIGFIVKLEIQYLPITNASDIYSASAYNHQLRCGTTDYNVGSVKPVFGPHDAKQMRLRGFQ